MYREELEQGLPSKSKDSQKLLELKARRDQLSRQKEYIDAHLVHVEVSKMEETEQEAFEQERKNKITTQLNHLHQKQKQELSALQMKIKKGHEEQIINKSLEEDRLQLKYKVVIKDIGSRQVVEKNFLKKSQKNPGLNSSRYVTQSRFSQSRSRLG